MFCKLHVSVNYTSKYVCLPEMQNGSTKFSAFRDHISLPSPGPCPSFAWEHFAKQQSSNEMPAPHGRPGLAGGHEWCILREPMGCNWGHLSHSVCFFTLSFSCCPTQTRAHTHRDPLTVYLSLPISVWKHAPVFSPEVKQVAEEGISL